MAPAHVSVAARSLAAARCALCHDRLGHAPTICPRCATALHVDCRRGLLRCPTLGCLAPWREAPEPRNHAAWASALRLALLVALGPMLASAGLAGASAVLAVAFHFLVGPAAWAAFDDDPTSPLRGSRVARFFTAGAVLLLLQAFLAGVLALLWLSFTTFANIEPLLLLVAAFEPAILSLTLFGRLGTTSPARA